MKKYYPTKYKSRIHNTFYKIEYYTIIIQGGLSSQIYLILLRDQS